MIPEDRRKPVAKTRAATKKDQAEQLLVLLAGAGALLLFLVA